MSRISLVYFTILWILLQVLVEVNCQMTPFKPSVFYGHTATLINNKLYVLGGLNFNGNPVKEFFYLDVSVPFNTQELSWKDLSDLNMVPPNYFATSVKGGPNNDTLFFYGGLTTDQTMALVYTFDSQSIVWSIPNITGVNTVRKYFLTAIINNDGRMYLWSGTVSGTNSFVNEMLILDTKNLSWSQGNLFNAPIPRRSYGTALLPNNKIIYMGGTSVGTTYNDKTLNIETGSALPLSEIYIYDTIYDNWDTKITSGKIPSNRVGFSTVLGIKYFLTAIINNDGRMYLWSGTVSGTNSFVNEMLILDTKNLSWSQGNLFNAPIPRRSYGTALLPNNKIIYMGGTSVGTTYNDKTLNIETGSALPLSEIYIYDTIYDNWDTKITSGKIPSNRVGLDGQRIIIYGGCFVNPGYLDTTLYVLDLNTYNWYVPKISGNIPNPRAFHKANVVGKYMVISFGNGDRAAGENDILLLDISNNDEYVWTTTFDPVDPSVPKNSTMPSPSFLPPSHPPSNNTTENELPIERNIHNYEQAINNNSEQEVVQIPRNENTINYEPIMILPPVINKNNYNKNTINHEPTITPVNNYYGQEIKNENATNHEPITIVDTNNYNYEQEVNPTSNNTNRLSSQILNINFFRLLNKKLTRI
ncbi:hypothetical protein RclHR1_05670011 [Rhizophagus clarus]|uniref:Galactose oxidase n=1 Tax=Rhizophagus clarus TaxID=94130 RepID=A0A2Z6SGF0_9GLOM|nr:hypothetical protein RclHR1_05670011 [Rhizophagus clarus]